ncbi:hypothetical protein AB0D78_03335 [Streptomyces avermitilis]|uniref:hypothetical protein n=1 Tax=Streptomyces avermitilis TaxID=33903 RepID=UPI0033DF9F8D
MSPSRSQDYMAVAVPASRPRSWDTPRPGQLVEVRLYRTGQLALRTEPDESVNLAALQAGAEEVAGHLARALIAHHPSAA